VTPLRFPPSRWFILLHRAGWTALFLAAAAAAWWIKAPGTAAVALAASVAHLALNALDRACRDYHLTDTHVVRRSGILRRAEVQVPLDRVQSITVLRSIRERLFGLGTLAVSTAGSDGFEFTWYMIPNPHAALDALRSRVPALRVRPPASE